MKKYVSALALAALIGAPAAQALETTFGGEFELNGYSVDRGDNDAFDDEKAYQQLTRVKAHFKTDAGIQVNTRINLSNNVWEGDSRSANSTGAAGVSNAFYDRSQGNVSLDYGYAVIPLGGGFTLTAGRTEANWANCFLTCDDRRDRVLVLGKLGSVTVGAGWDKRAEGVTNSNFDDGDMFQALAIGVSGGWLWGVAGAYFDGSETPSGYILDGAVLVSPYVKGKMGPVTLEGGYTYVGAAEDNTAFEEDSHAAFLRVGANFGVVGIEAQGVATIDGGLIDDGFDSFSSMINSSPDGNETPTAGILNIGGGLGQFISEEYDEFLVSARLTVTPFSKLKLMAAVGMYDLDRGAGLLTAVDDSTMFYDLQAHYQLADSTTLWATAGMVEEADFLADDVIAYSLNLRTTF